jgi:SAM-dependent methyltransferase
LATNTVLVRWRIGDRTFVGTASPVEDPGTLRTEVLPEYDARFGAQRVLEWFGSAVGCIALRESPQGIPYYGEVEAMFDQAADDYDGVVRGNPLNMHLREVSREILRGLFRPGERVLEIGCGTGLETLPLAEAGVNVVALDISAKMLAVLDRHARGASLQGRIETRKAAAGDLAEIVSEFGPGSFDGAFSHFGALNCEPHLRRLPAALHQLVKQDGRISLGILNRTCLSELILFNLAFQPRRAFARLNPTLPVGQSRFGVLIFPYGPQEIKSMFSPQFLPERTIGVSVFVPPSNFGGRVVHYPGLVSLLEAADRAVSRLPLVRGLGDYFLMEMRRR